jgi:hypothetical protein
MKRIKGNADWQKNIEMRWLIDDADSCENPLEILQQKTSVFEKAEHAQVHADAGHQPRATQPRTFSLCNSPAEPKIHGGRRKKQRGKWRIPRAVKNVACNYQKIFPSVPGTYAPVSSDDDCKKDDER